MKTYLTFLGCALALMAIGATFQNEFTTNPPANPVTGPIIFKGPVGTTNMSVYTNLNANNLMVTNATKFMTTAGSTASIDASQTLSTLSTNNNVAYGGFINIDTLAGNSITRVYTNTAGSAAVKVITFPVGTLMISPPFTNVVYNTNQGVFSCLIVPGFGTNATWTGF